MKVILKRGGVVMSKKMGFYPESAKGISEEHIEMVEKPKQKAPYDMENNGYDSSESLKEDKKGE